VVAVVRRHRKSPVLTPDGAQLGTSEGTRAGHPSREHAAGKTRWQQPATASGARPALHLGTGWRKRCRDDRWVIAVIEQCTGLSNVSFPVWGCGNSRFRPPDLPAVLPFGPSGMDLHSGDHESCIPA